MFITIPISSDRSPIFRVEISSSSYSEGFVRFISNIASDTEVLLANLEDQLRTRPKREEFYYRTDEHGQYVATRVHSYKIAGSDKLQLIFNFLSRYGFINHAEHRLFQTSIEKIEKNRENFQKNKSESSVAQIDLLHSFAEPYLEYIASARQTFEKAWSCLKYCAYSFPGKCITEKLKALKCETDSELSLTLDTLGAIYDGEANLESAFLQSGNGIPTLEIQRKCLFEFAQHFFETYYSEPHCFRKNSSLFEKINYIVFQLEKELFIRGVCPSDTVGTSQWFIFSMLSPRCNVRMDSVRQQIFEETKIKILRELGEEEDFVSKHYALYSSESQQIREEKKEALQLGLFQLSPNKETVAWSKILAQSGNDSDLSSNSNKPW